ncbi:uncharacterized protein WCC33_014966 [Rhinophrynus dorsalis]
MGQIGEAVFNHSLEIIQLLTGEDCVVMKKHTASTSFSQDVGVPVDLSKTKNLALDLTFFERAGKEERRLMTEKIIDLANKIIQLLTRQVPIKCEDVAVYLSVDEWKYLEEHKEHYKAPVTEAHQSPCPQNKGNEQNEKRGAQQAATEETENDSPEPKPPSPQKTADVIAHTLRHIKEEPMETAYIGSGGTYEPPLKSVALDKPKVGPPVPPSHPPLYIKTEPGRYYSGDTQDLKQEEIVSTVHPHSTLEQDSIIVRQIKEEPLETFISEDICRDAPQEGYSSGIIKYIVTPGDSYGQTVQQSNMAENLSKVSKKKIPVRGKRMSPHASTLSPAEQAARQARRAKLDEELRALTADSIFEPCFPYNPSRTTPKKVPEDVDGRVGNKDWCSCGNCIIMPTAVESICCQEIPSAHQHIGEGSSCILNNPEFISMCLNASRVDFQLRFLGPSVSRQMESNYSRNLRKTAYRLFIIWVHNALKVGRKCPVPAGTKCPVPACVVSAVRKTFPDTVQERFIPKSIDYDAAEMALSV